MHNADKNILCYIKLFTVLLLFNLSKFSLVAVLFNTLIFILKKNYYIIVLFLKPNNICINDPNINKIIEYLNTFNEKIKYSILNILF